MRYAKRWPDIYEARGMNPDYPIPGAETPFASGMRFSQAIYEILRSSEGDIAIVAHTDVIFFFICILLDSKTACQTVFFVFPCGSYYHLNTDDNDHVILSDLTYLLPHPDLHDETMPDASRFGVSSSSCTGAQ